MWITGNRYLNQEEMKNNALIVARLFRENGWTDNAIAGVLGNLEYESTINPTIWEGLIPDRLNRGYGLFQFTPSGKYQVYCEDKGYSFPPDSQKDGEYQINFIIENSHYYNGDLYIEYIQSADYPLTYTEYKTSKLAPDYLGRVWLYNVERPNEAYAKPEERAAASSKWFDFLTGHPYSKKIWVKRLKKNTFYVIGGNANEN